MDNGLNPFAPFLKAQRAVVLDGGLATAIEALGADLDDPLWSAKILLEDVDTIRQVHRAYLEAGADCIATCTYQATVPGFARRGFDTDQAIAVIARAVGLAIDERDAFWEQGGRAGRVRPLVAGSIGPYGAFLANGAEYTGAYDIAGPALRRFHEPRWRTLAGSGVDILACETIPSLAEVEALLGLLADTPRTWCWLSLYCRDEETLADGSRLEDALKLANACSRVAAVGANCMAPEQVPDLVRRMRALTDRPIMMYPNLGETYAPGGKKWSGCPSLPVSEWNVAGWLDSGLDIVGGCCRTGPADIRRLRNVVLSTEPGGPPKA